MRQRSPAEVQAYKDGYLAAARSTSFRVTTIMERPIEDWPADLERFLRLVEARASAVRDA